MQRAQKKEEVSQLRGLLSEAQLIVVAHFLGLVIPEMSDLRKRMRAGGGRLRVVKNRLARRALEGTKHALLNPLLSGPTVLAISDDPITAARIAVTYRQDNEKLKIQGGVLNGCLLTVEEVVELAHIPAIEVSRAQIMGLLTSPARSLIACLQEPAARLARIMQSCNGGADKC